MASHTIRSAAVAGLFYPADSRTLITQLHKLLAHAAPSHAMEIPKALIVPHAGYVYSGPVAAQAYALLTTLRHVVRRVVLLGPSHRVPLKGMALPGSTAFSTPLGTVNVDSDAINMLMNEPDVCIDDRAHDAEHALEVQLPFLQTVLNYFHIVPVTVGFSEPSLVASLIEKLWGGPETLIVVSSDLSHYNSYAQARDLDGYAVDRILALDPVLDHEQACGATAVNALLQLAQRHHLTPHLLDARNSGDTAGDRSRVVGYAAISFSENERIEH
ncbi:MAG TPA: AmmeMemoRadiSam system protein B [Rhodocyclaceae bacterium]|nr:AmmeMemoRadiSam system protein B [Rhodocyclaceae bacterium]